MRSKFLSSPPNLQKGLAKNSLTFGRDIVMAKLVNKQGTNSADVLTYNVNGKIKIQN